MKSGFGRELILCWQSLALPTQQESLPRLDLIGRSPHDFFMQFALEPGPTAAAVLLTSVMLGLLYGLLLFGSVIFLDQKSYFSQSFKSRVFPKTFSFLVVCPNVSGLYTGCCIFNNVLWNMYTSFVFIMFLYVFFSI